MDATTAPGPAGAAPAAAKRASGSSFYWAMRILPAAQRQAMYEIYSFCRRVDDIADSDAPRADRLAELAGWRRAINAIYEDEPNPHVADIDITALARAVRMFDLARQDFLAIIDGMEMDTVADIRAPTLATLDLYCDRVASAVGRLSVHVFGLEGEPGIQLAHHLGRALQLTNILRDLDEDAGVGRLYLPQEALRQAGITTTDPVTALASPRLPHVCGILVERAREHFSQAERILAASPRSAVRAPRIMGAVYRAILEALVARGFSPPRRPVRVPRARLVWILLRYALI